MIYLNIGHVIHLTKEQRYKLHEGEEIEVIGISIPVWNKGEVTTEPAKEVFCKYYLKNPKLEIPIQIEEDGYTIYLPMRPSKRKKALTNDQWRYMANNDPDALENYYNAKVTEISSRNLLDVEDGGNGCLIYREQNKIKWEEKTLQIIHYVNIESMEHLTESI